jgi:hypothetical protein
MSICARATNKQLHICRHFLCLYDMRRVCP